MPSASQLQAAGQHHLIAAIRQRGGFKTIATKIGLSPQRLDKRGRKPRQPVTEESAEEAKPAGIIPQQALDTQEQFEVPAERQAEVYEQTSATEELQLV